MLSSLTNTGLSVFSAIANLIKLRLHWRICGVYLTLAQPTNQNLSSPFEVIDNNGGKLLEERGESVLTEISTVNENVLTEP